MPGISDDHLSGSSREPGTPSGSPDVRLAVVRAVALGLLALIASEVLVELRAALSAPPQLWSSLISVLGLAGLPFLAPFVLRLQAAGGWRAAVGRIVLTLATSYGLAVLVALAFAPHPAAEFVGALGLAATSALASVPILLPAALYAIREKRADAMMIVVLVSVCVVMPIPSAGGLVLALLLLWRRALVDRMP